jgi:hypothetical protein
LTKFVLGELYRQIPTSSIKRTFYFKKGLKNPFLARIYPVLSCDSLVAKIEPTMIKFIGNILFCLFIVFLFGDYFHYRFLNGYETSELFKVDGIVQALVAAILFLVLVFLMVKPSIKIADNIAELPQKNHTPEHFRIKIVNHSLFRAYDLELSVFHKERISISGFDIKSTLVVHLKGVESGTSYLQSALLALFDQTRTNAAQLRFHALDNVADQKIKEILESETSYLEIHVSVRHGLSGIQGNYVKKYHNMSNVMKGYYKHGFLTGIKLS